MEREKRRILFMQEPYLNLPYFSFSQKPKDLTTKADKHYHAAILILTRLGLCQNDKAALKDLESLSKKSYGKLFQEAEALYIDTHAKRLGLKTNHFKMIKDYIKNNRTKIGERISYEPQKLFSMQARLKAEQWQKASELVPNLTKLCDAQIEKLKR